MSHREQWLLRASLGLLTIGAGISLSGQATILKSRDQSPQWIILGSLGLAVLNLGVSMVGDAVKHRTLHELELARAQQTL